MLDIMRRTGKTTRIIDRCIQELFNNGVTHVYCETRSDTGTDDVAKRFINRLNSEHRNAKYVSSKTTVDGIYCLKVELHDL